MNNKLLYLKLTLSTVSVFAGIAAFIYMIVFLLTSNTTWIQLMPILVLILIQKGSMRKILLSSSVLLLSLIEIILLWSIFYIFLVVVVGSLDVITENVSKVALVLLLFDFGCFSLRQFIIKKLKL